MSERFFDRLVRESGLPSLIAAPALRRSVARAGLDAEVLEASDLDRVLPSIETTLRVYLSDSKADESLGKIRRLGDIFAGKEPSHAEPTEP